MTDKDDLWVLEKKFWTEGADGVHHLTAKGAIAVLPYPAGILVDEAIWRNNAVAQRWRTVAFSDLAITRKGDVAVLAYCVSAERAEDTIYEALCTSTYLNDDGVWLRLSHQQTPSGPHD